MVKINENFLKLEKNYLFINIAKKVDAFKAANPDAALIRMGIGDVTLPLAPVVVEAMKKGADEMGVKETFKGYEDSGAGYDFLKNAIADYYKSFGADVSADEIRVNDGAKSDCGNIVDIFGDDNVVLITDPAYPVYVDSNRMSGRKVIFADSNEENGFAAMPDDSVHADLIYLCSPNNPTGSVYTKEQLAEWVAYAKRHESIIIFDAAYEAFITDPALPRSIFQIEGAKECAIEMCSLSKTAGFTGVRCGYTVVPEALKVKASDGTEVSIAQLWGRRQGTKFNGVSYPVQCAAAAVFTEEGQKQIKENIRYYQENAKIIAETMESLGIKYTGGVNSPYIWFKCPDGMGSWEFFDKMLAEIAVVGTPGEGFGKNGDGWFRLTAFGDRDNTIEAMRRFKEMLSK
ncbi:MAG: LL-diaminopimelate aminotransferase [Oscillospiraceae bacterium]|nr:LL-diaminopimelate aminotransferase [Oscillospiraceae bacterium]MBQ7003861.1 LL-diaminopimelate aminotransferase [Oscillospiraceae bacterium]